MSSPTADAPAAPYDRHAALYDRLIGNRTYNRLLWGVDPAAYTDFAREALEAGDGPFLDAGCGTAVFTAAAYRQTSRELVLVDLSQGMLDVAARRLDGVPARLVRADLLALPFPPGGFETVGCFAMLHVLDDPWAVLAALREQLAPGGRLFASMLVADRAVGRRYAALLRRRGEFGPPCTASDLAAAAAGIFAASEVTRTGSMAWLRARG